MGDQRRPNRVYLRSRRQQMKLTAGPRGEIVLRLTDDPPENGCRPLWTICFVPRHSIFPDASVAAILTGMGNDGTAGLRMLKRSGCFSIAQDEASCVVFGMPKERDSSRSDRYRRAARDNRRRHCEVGARG